MISRFELRRLVESVLLEGFKDDQRYLIETHPDHARDLDRLPPKWIAWLSARYGERPTREEIHPFEDTIATIKKFAERDGAIGQKYTSSAQFKEAIDQHFPPDLRAWKAPNDAATMSVDEMELILRLSEMKKQRFKVDEKIDIEGDRVGKVGSWNLWLPTTRERSCSIAQYDPVTREPKTTWCTARTAGSNLFYNYIGRPDQNITLFYVIRDDPKGDEDWLSVGFINGKPELKGQDGGLSVDRANVGLTPAKLQDILGSDHDEIMQILKEKNVSLGGKHPARQKVLDAAKSVEALRYLVVGLGEEEATDLKDLVLKERVIDPGVLMVLANDKSEIVRAKVAERDNLSPEILVRLADDESEIIRQSVAKHSNSPQELLMKLTDDESELVKTAICLNLGVTAEVLAKLAVDPSVKIRSSLVFSPRISTELLARLARDESEIVRMSVARRFKSPQEILMKLVDDESDHVKMAISQNLGATEEVLRKLVDFADERTKYFITLHEKVSSDILMKIAKSPDLGEVVKIGLAANEKTPPEVLMDLTQETSLSIITRIAENPSAPPEVLRNLVGNPDSQVLKALAMNSNTPEDVLATLANNRDSNVRALVAKHRNTSIETLRKLEVDKLSSRARKEATKNLQGRQQALNERRLRQLIRRML